jgi:hypothetical protein
MLRGAFSIGGSGFAIAKFHDSPRTIPRGAPHPPPPGVTTRNTSPGWSWNCDVPDWTRSRPSRVTIEFRPAVAGAPPRRP